jgi:hypothetical protein
MFHTTAISRAGQLARWDVGPRFLILGNFEAISSGNLAHKPGNPELGTHDPKYSNNGWIAAISTNSTPEGNLMILSCHVRDVGFCEMDQVCMQLLIQI